MKHYIPLLEVIAENTRMFELDVPDYDVASIPLLRPELHGGLEVGPRVSSLCAGLTPELVVLGYDADAAADVLAGLYVGWIRDVAATVGAFRHGTGAGIVCTWPLLGSYDRDPLAAALLDRLIDLAARPGFRPKTGRGAAT